jgi:alpha-ketoglutarate-dependent taurine dioxygenase
MTQWSVRELTPLGAEIVGADLRGPLDDHQIRELRELFDDRGVLAFRDVEIDTDAQERLTYDLIGRVAPGEFRDRPEGPRKESYISNKEEGGIAPFGRLLWHSDAMWSDQAFEALSLFGVHVEQPSAPTLFASAVRAWNALPEDLRSRVEHLDALHTTGQVDRGRYEEGEVLKPVRTEEKTTTAPLALRHPRTGKSILYVCEQCTLEVSGMPHDASEALLEELFECLYDDEYVYEHHWRQGDLVIWDNLAVQHGRADVTTEGPARTLRKIFAPKMQLAMTPETPRFTRTA